MLARRPRSPRPDSYRGGMKNAVRAEGESPELLSDSTRPKRVPIDKAIKDR